MTRDQLEHLIGAAAVTADDNTIVVIGSQAVLGQFPDARAAEVPPDSLPLFAEEGST